MLTFSESRVAVAKALLDVQRELQPVVKDRQNPHIGNKYATLDAITDYVRPILVKHGLLLVQGAERSENGLVVTTCLQHESGEWVASSVYVPLIGQAVKGGGVGPVSPQSAGSAITYGRRYGLSCILAITTDEDDDGQRGSTKQRKAALQESRESAAANDAKAVRAADVPFPPTKEFKQYEGHPLRDVPTDVLEAAYLRFQAHSGKSAARFAEAIGDVLEDRRGGA